VHWGFFSKSLPPLIEVSSGDFVTIETVTHPANAPHFSYPNYLAELGPKAQSDIYGKSSDDLALRDAFREEPVRAGRLNRLRCQ
jgi:hypothetical protein